jgi:hypothetical protein
MWFVARIVITVNAINVLQYRVATAMLSIRVTIVETKRAKIVKENRSVLNVILFSWTYATTCFVQVAMEFFVRDALINSTGARRAKTLFALFAVPSISGVTDALSCSAKAVNALTALKSKHVLLKERQTRKSTYTTH